MGKEVFCCECRDDVEYIVNDIQTSGTIKGVKYNYLGKIAHCCNCGAEVYVDEINDYNLKNLYNEYRKKNGIVSLDIILKIPEKYNIGKRPLSLLLGWGEQTFSRYYDGDIPTKQYSDVLQKIYDDPIYYREMLKKNRNNLKDSAYERSMNAVNKIIGVHDSQCTDNDFNDKYLYTDVQSHKSNVFDVAKYILEQMGRLSTMKLQKLCYYSQAWSLVWDDEPLFDEEFHAWENGPVCKELFYKTQGRFSVTASDENGSSENLTKNQKNTINSVIEYYGGHDAQWLSRLSHMEDPWKNARDKSADEIITKESMGLYYGSL